MQNIDWSEIYVLIDNLWDGPLDVVRSGTFNAENSKLIRDVLSSIRIPKIDPLPRKFVSEIWYLPIFLERNKPKVQTVNSAEVAAEYDDLCSWVFNKVNELIGD